MTCPWEFPDRHPDGTYHQCRGKANVAVVYRVGPRTVTYCLNHAQSEVLGGQARYVCTTSHPCVACAGEVAQFGWPTMGEGPGAVRITYCDVARISADGP